MQRVFCLARLTVLASICNFSSGCCDSSNKAPLHYEVWQSLEEDLANARSTSHAIIFVASEQFQQTYLCSDAHVLIALLRFLGDEFPVFDTWTSYYLARVTMTYKEDMPIAWPQTETALVWSPHALVANQNGLTDFVTAVVCTCV